MIPYPEALLYLIVVLCAVVALVLLASIIRSQVARGTARKADQEATREILSRVGTGAEVTAFLNSEGGRQFLRTMVSVRPNGNGREGLLRMMAIGIVLICFGIGLMIPRLFYRIPEFTAVITMIGVGMVIASRVALRMRKEWEEEEETRSVLTRGAEGVQQPMQESSDPMHGLD
jgi:hypothetical protein